MTTTRQSPALADFVSRDGDLEGTRPAPTVEHDPYTAMIERVIPDARTRPHQDRAIITLRRILVTADTIVSREGPDRFTMKALGEEAGVSIGTVYRYFADRSAVLDALDPHRHDAARRLADVRLYLERTQVALAVSRAVTTATQTEAIVDHALDIIQGAHA